MFPLVSGASTLAMLRRDLSKPKVLVSSTMKSSICGGVLSDTEKPIQ
jgi:hypothetical protein